MKIVFFSTYYYPYISGLTVYPRSIVQHLTKKHEVDVYTFKHSKELPSEEIDRQVRIHRMSYSLRVSKGFISPQSILVFFKAVKKADLVILNVPNFEGLPLAGMAFLYRIPTISLFHCQVMLGAGFTNRLINSVLNISVYLQLYLSKKIVVSTIEYAKYLKLDQRFKSKIVPITPVISSPIFHKQSFQRFQREKKDEVWVGYCGRIAREKGIKYAIDAIALLAKDLNIRLVLAGPTKEVVGEDKYALNIRSYLNKVQLKYTFFGKLNSKQLSAFYQNLDVLVLPSIQITEAFGLVQAEAMLCGVPVIATNLPGVRWSIQQTQMGILVEPHDSRQIANAIVKITNNKKSYSNSTLVARAKKTFNTSATLAQFDHIVTFGDKSSRHIT